MAESISTIFAQTVRFTSTYQFQTVDQDGTNTRTLATGYYRVLCAEAAGAGTSETACAELLTAFENALNTSGSRYAVTMSSTGYVQVTYNGTGTSTLTWTSSASNGLRSVLGFSSGWSSLASGATTTAGSQPSHVAYAFCLADDSGWTVESGHQALAETPSAVFGWSDQAHRVVRSFTLRFHPTLDSDRSALDTSPITPALPSTHTRTSTPSASVIAGGPWSLHELVQTALSDGTYYGCLGVCIGNFSNLRSGVSVTVDQAYWRPEARLKAQVSPSVAYWSRRRDMRNLSLLRVGTLSVSL